MAGGELLQDGTVLSGALGALLSAGARGALLLMVVLVAGLALRKASAATRHALWGAAFLVVLLLPLSGLLPWRLPVLPATGVVEAPVRGDALAAPPGALPMRESPDPAQKTAWPRLDGPGAQRSTPAQPGPVSGASDVEADPHVALTGVQDATADAQTGLVAPGALRRLAAALSGDAGALPSALLIAWLTGVLLVGGRLVAGHWLVHRMIQRSEPVADSGWTTPLWESADRLDVATDVALRRSGEAAIPFATGVLRPTIVLPASADAWDEDRRRAVLMHELAHVRRRDLLLHYLARWACVLYWFNPLAWIGARRLRAESERAADDLVLGAGTRPSDYADHLLQIVAAVGGRSMPAPALPLAQRREFEGRMLAILEPHRTRTGPSRLQSAGMVGAVVLLALPLAALAPADIGHRDDAAARGEVADERTAGPARSEAPAPKPDARPNPMADPDSGPDAQPDAWSNRNSNLNTNSNTNSDSDSDSGDERDSAADRYAEGLMTAAGVAAGLLDAGSFDVVMRQVNDGKVEVRMKAAQELGSVDEDPRAVQALIQLLEGDPVADVRRAAALALGEMEATAAVPALSRALLEDDSADVRMAAAWALGEIEDPAAAGALATAIGDSSEEVSEAAIWALGEIEDPQAVPALIDALTSGNVLAARKAAWALGEIEDPAAVDALIATLGRSGDAEVRRFSAWALAEIEDPRAAEALARALNDDDAEVRSAAIRGLAEMDDPAAVPGLVRALSDRDPEVRAYAAWALGEIRMERAPEQLLQALRDDSPKVRAAAAHALAEIEDPASVPGLVAALDDPSGDVREMAAHALAELDTDEAIEALVKALSDGDPNVRRRAAEAIGSN